MLRMAKEKPADKKVSLQYQSLVSRLHSYPSCYYKMFFRYWSEHCDTAVTHISMSLAVLHLKENPTPTAVQLCKIIFTDPNGTRTRSKRQQYGENYSRACGQLRSWLSRNWRYNSKIQSA